MTRSHSFFPARARRRRHARRWGDNAAVRQTLAEASDALGEDMAA
jgi:hypothetical protein